MAKYKKIKLSEARARIEQIDEISKKKAQKQMKEEAELDENNSTIVRKMGQSRTLRKIVPGLGKNEAGERAKDNKANAGWASEAKPTYGDGTPNPNYEADKAEAGRSQRAASRYNKIAAKEEVELEEGKMKEIITKHMDAGLSYEEALKKAQKQMKEEAEQIDEKLIGNQKKIDKNHNGKLDAQDFKMLRSKKMEESAEGRPYLVVHAKKGRHECHATSSYEAAKKAAAHWGLKSTAGVDAHLADVKHSTASIGENAGCDMTDTDMGGADQIATSSTGEIYKKSDKKTTGPSPATGTETHVVAGKTGEAYNTTGITKRVPAVESAAMSVFAKTLEKRRLFEDASNIAIISPEQRQDWLNVSTGTMDVVDYFNKYKV